MTLSRWGRTRGSYSVTDLDMYGTAIGSAARKQVSPGLTGTPSRRASSTVHGFSRRSAQRTRRLGGDRARLTSCSGRRYSMPDDDMGQQVNHRPASQHGGVPRSPVVVGFAPSTTGVCLSRAGRWRDSHEWDRDCCCIYCDELRLGVSY